MGFGGVAEQKIVVPDYTYAQPDKRMVPATLAGRPPVPFFKLTF